MKKFIAALLVISGLLAGAATLSANEDQWKGVAMSGTADVYIDSSLTAAVMRNKRCVIRGIYAYYDNAANTNPIHIQVVRGTSALRVQNSQRYFKFGEAMTSGGYKAYSWEPNVVVDGDSTIYFAINAASSDSLFLHVTYELIN